MKAILYIIPMLALAACSGDEVINTTNTDPNEIRLSVTSDYSPKVTSRYAHTGNLKSGFKLWAVKSDNPADVYFDDEVVNYSSSDNSYSFAAGKRYWPSDNSNKLNFYAVHLNSTEEQSYNSQSYSDTPKIEYDANGAPQFVINNVCTITDNVNTSDKLAINWHDDMVYAVTENAAKSDNDGVLNLNFKHALTKVQVEATTENPALFVGIAHNGVTICGIKNKGNVTISKNTSGDYACSWTATTDATTSKDLTFNNDQAILLADYSENVKNNGTIEVKDRIKNVKLSQNTDYPAFLVPQKSEDGDKYGSSIYLKVRCIICGLGSEKSFNDNFYAKLINDGNLTETAKLNLAIAAVLTGVNATIHGTTAKYGPYGAIVYGENVEKFSDIFPGCSDDLITSADTHLNVDACALYKDIYIPLKNVDWQPGKAYCYNLIFDFTPDEGSIPVYDPEGNEVKNLYITVNEVEMDNEISLETEQIPLVSDQ